MSQVTLLILSIACQAVLFFLPSSLVTQMLWFGLLAVRLLHCSQNKFYPCLPLDSWHPSTIEGTLLQSIPCQNTGSEHAMEDCILRVCHARLVQVLVGDELPQSRCWAFEGCAVTMRDLRGSTSSPEAPWLLNMMGALKLGSLIADIICIVTMLNFWVSFQPWKLVMIVVINN